MYRSSGGPYKTQRGLREREWETKARAGVLRVSSLAVSYTPGKPRTVTLPTNLNRLCHECIIKELS